MSAIQRLKNHLELLCNELEINFAERAEQVESNDKNVHLTFTYDEEDQVDKLIRSARTSIASFGPEYWLPEHHPGASRFLQSAHMPFKVRKSLVRSHLYWAVTFTLIDAETGYSLLEDTQP